MRLVRRCGDLVEQGHGEIVLTGVDITSYGPDIGAPGLGTLVRAILDRVPDLMRLRLSSIDAVEMMTGLLDMVIPSRLMPHLHLSLQAGDNMILKRMKRRHSREEAIDFCDKLRAARPDMTFGADLIAGFPTETDAMFENSLKLVDDCDLSWLHVFPFSPRPGTPAAKMPQSTARPSRRARLNCANRDDAQRQMAGQANRQDDQRLVEKNAVTDEGRAEDFARVRVAGRKRPAALLTICTITGHDGADARRGYPMSGLFRALKSGLSKSSQALGDSLLSWAARSSPPQLNELEDALIMADLGVATAGHIVDNLRQRRDLADLDEAGLRAALADEIAALLVEAEKPFRLPDKNRW